MWMIFHVIRYSDDNEYMPHEVWTNGLVGTSIALMGGEINTNLFEREDH